MRTASVSEGSLCGREGGAGPPSAGTPAPRRLEGLYRTRRGPAADGPTRETTDRGNAMNETNQLLRFYTY